MGGKKNKSKKNKNKNKNKNKSNNNNNNDQSGRRNKLKKIAAENFGKFSEQLSKIGLRIKESCGDGNCLFRSFADQLEGNEDNYQFYKKQTLEYMVQNKENFEPFIEDDKKFDEYIEEMSNDGKWGGNLEIQGLSMRFQVNFFIHIYDHPMYILSNFPNPMKNVHLSYHDGSHYNSVRLTDDLANDIPLEINSDLIKGIQQTSDINLLSQIEEKNNQVLDKEELNKSNDSESENDNNYKIKEEKKKCVEEKQVDEIEQENQLIYKAVKIKDTEEMNKKIKYIKKMLNKNGQFYYEIDDKKKCHCLSNRIYKNCCKEDDIPGDFNEENNEFYCDIEKFIMFYSTLPNGSSDNERRAKNDSIKNVNVDKTDKILEGDIAGIEKKMGTIYI